MSETKKSLGFLSILSLTVGTMVGVGILIAPSMLYKFGRYGYFAWPVASLLCLGLAVMFSRLSQMTAKPGPAGFVQEAFGHLSSFQVAWVHWVGFTIAQAVICYSFGQYVGPYVTSLTSMQLSMIALWTTALISCFLTIFSIGVVMAITAMKIFVLTMIILFGLPYLNVSAITTLPVIGNIDGMSAFIAAVSVCLLSFIGLEVATLPSGNVKNPKVTIPLATVVATVVAAVLYTLSYAVVGSAMSQAELATSTRPMVDAATLFMGRPGGLMLTILGGVGFFATINGMLYGQSFILRHMSIIQVLPRVFSRTTASGFPASAALFSAAVSSIILMYVNQANLGMYGSIATCFVSIAYLWSVMAYRHLGGSILLWAFNFLTALAFLFGSLADHTHLIPVAILVYCTSFFVYGVSITSTKLDEI